MTASSFAARVTRSLKREGVEGAPARATLDGGTLVVTGAKGGIVRIEAALTTRLRIGCIETRQGRFFKARIWREGASAPLIIEPEKSDAASYGAMLSGFARAVAAARGLGAVERGNTAIGAAASFGMLMIPVLGYSAVALALAGPRDWWGWSIGAALCWAFALVAMLHWRKEHPRPVRDLGELRRYLPPGAQ